MEAVYFFKMLVTISQATLSHNPEDHMNFKRVKSSDLINTDFLNGCSGIALI
jgi:hypothetical protein